MAEVKLEERKSVAAREIRDLLDWNLQEEIKITEKLKATGKFKPGLDGNLEDYAPLNKELKKRVEQIFQKHNLPLNTRLKLW